MGAPGGATRSAHEQQRVVAVRRTSLAVAFGVLVTALILLTPLLSFGVRSGSAHLALNTLDAFIALLVAYLLHGRFQRNGRVQDALLTQGLVLLAVSGLGLDLVAALAEDSPGDLWVWLSLAFRLLGAGSFAAAALAGDRTMTEYRAGSLSLAFLPVILVTSGVLLLAHGRLPEALPLSELPASAQHPFLTGHPALLAIQGLSAVAFALAAVVFTVRGSRTHDELMRWLGPACVLGAFARLNYLLFPSLYTDWLYTGDVLRTGTYLVLLVGAAREIRQYWAAQSELAVVEDRRRQARELHDGVIQELGYIRGEATLLADVAEASTRIVDACDRALDEARAVVHLLGSGAHEPLAATLRRSLLQLAERYDVDLALALDPQVRVNGEARHAVVRIAREAVGNAARHSGAGTVRVSLHALSDGTALVVEDDGAGFDVAAALARGTTYGLTSMDDRARGLPGRLHIWSLPGRGSKVTVTW